MKKIFTQQPTSMTATPAHNHCANNPEKQTVAFLRQFARVYQPTTANLPGVILN